MRSNTCKLAMLLFALSAALLLHAPCAHAEGEGEGEAPPCYLGDIDCNGVLDLSEQIRIVQFSNLPEYHCDAIEEDGFATGPGDHSCVPHSADFYPQDWSISQEEMEYAMRLADGYFPCGDSPGTGGFCSSTARTTADIDGDRVIIMSELLRVVQLYNVGGYQCAASATEDGFEPGAGARHSCTPHDADFQEQDWVITMSELLRSIQLFNMGSYHLCLGGEDGFCPDTF